MKEHMLENKTYHRKHIINLLQLISTNIFFLLYFLSFSTSIFSQNVTIDSLKIELQNHTERDTVRVNLLNDLAYLCRNKNSEKAIIYVKEAEVIAKAIKFKKGSAKSLYTKGAIKAVQSNYIEGLRYYNEALELYKTINLKTGIAECYTGIGTCYFYKADYKQAITYYQKSVQINKDIGHHKNLSTSLLYTGMSYSRLGKYPEAIVSYKKALTINTKVNNEQGMSRCFTSIGSIYNYQGNYPLALEYFNKSLSINEKYGDTLGMSNSLNNIGIIYYGTQNYDKAIEFYEKVLEFQHTNGDKKGIALVINNLGLAYKEKKNYKIAHKYLKDALKIYQKINDKAYVARCLNNIGDVYIQLKKYPNAYQNFEKAKKLNLEVENQFGLCNSYLGIATVYTNQKKYHKALINALKSKELSTKLKLINYQSDVFKLLSEIYNNIRNYKKALSNHEQFKILNDSLFNKENIEKITQLEYEYKYKQALDSASIRELKLTKTVKITSQNLEKSQQDYLLVIIGFLLISILLGSIIFYQKFRNVKSKTQNILIEQKLLRSQMTPHFIFNSLSVLQGMILNKEEKKSIHYLSKFSKLLRIILENSRDKTVSLSQELAAIENYLALQNLENEAYKHTVLVDDNIAISSFKIPPMLIQPFVENATEHAFVNQKENKEIDIHLSYSNKNLICTITDNGVGIESQKETQNPDKKSVSTTITTERLKILSKDFKVKGSVTIEDRKKHNKQGTIVTLVIPYKIQVA